MQKLKYLIILSLGILLTLVYVQLDDYDNISNSLLDDNIKANQTIKDLQETIGNLKKQNEKLQEDIVFLYNKIDNLNLEIESIENEAIREKILIEEEENTLQTSEPLTLENENTITGFGTTDE